MKVSELLKSSKELIIDPTHWTQKYLARDQNGKSTNYAGEDAVCWCSLGAVEKITIDVFGSEYLVARYNARNAAIDCLNMASNGCGCITTFNDEHTHEEVIDMFDKAIALAQKDEA